MEMEPQTLLAYGTAAMAVIATIWEHARKAISDKRTRFVLSLGLKIADVYEDGEITSEETTVLIEHFKKELETLKEPAGME